MPSRRASLDWVTGKKEPSPPTCPLGIPAAPSPGEEEGRTPTERPEVEAWITTEVGPSVAAVPVGEETTAIPDFTTEPENQTEWEPAYTPAGTSPLPGLCGLGSGPRPDASHAWQPRVCPGGGRAGWSPPGTCALFPQPLH